MNLDRGVRQPPPSAPRKARWVGLLLLLAGIAPLAAAVLRSGSWVVANDLAPADVLLVTDYFADDRYFWTAVLLMNQGYGHDVVVLAGGSGLTFGSTDLQRAAQFVRQLPPSLSARIRVCDDDAQPATVERCLAASHARRVLLVSPSVDSRRSLMAFRRMLPRYEWHSAAVDDPAKFRPQWWQRRAWAKYYAHALCALLHELVLRK